MSGFITGIDPTERVAGTGTSSDEGNEFGVKTLGATMDGDGTKLWEYVHAQEAITAGAAVLIHETGEAEMVDTTSSAPAAGQGLAVGFATAAFADNEFGWVQRVGVISSILVGTSAAVHTALNSTATAGTLDDDATAGAEVINGVSTTAAESGGAAAAVLDWPRVGRTL